MPIIDSRLKTGLLTVDGVQYATQVTNVTLSPDSKEDGDSLETLSGDTVLPAEKTSWTLKVEAVQDFDDAAGFVNSAMTKAGDDVAFTWRPGPAVTSPSYTGTVKVRAVDIGGDVGSRLTTSAEWPIQGTPVVAYPPVGP